MFNNSLFYFFCVFFTVCENDRLTVFAMFCFVLGCIIRIYMVAYDSLYPLLITEGNYQKAYSIQSILDTVSMVMVPVAAFRYRAFPSFVGMGVMVMEDTADSVVSLPMV